MKIKGMSSFLSFFLIIIVSFSFFMFMSIESKAIGNYVISEPVLTDVVDYGSISLSEPVSTDLVLDGSLTPSYILRSQFQYSSNNLGLICGLDDDSYYSASMTISGNMTFDNICFIRGFGIKLIDKPVYFNGFGFNSSGGYDSHDLNITFDIVLPGYYFNNAYLDLCAEILSYDYNRVKSYSLDLSVSLNSISILSDSESLDYQNGYNAGYSAGEESGYSSGYSSGYDDGVNSVDQDAIYDEGYQAGADSVDTQSYYDAGYNAGYSVGFSEGYDQGYDDGFSEGYILGYDTGYFDSYRDDYSEESSPLNFNILKSVDNFSISSYPNTFNIRYSDTGNSTSIDSSDGSSVLHDYFINSHNKTFYFFDVLIKANELPILTPTSNWDGCILEVSSNLNSFDKSQISSFNIGISSDSLSSSGNSLGVFNSENFGSTQIINVDFTKTGYSPLYFYLDLNDCSAWFSYFSSGDQFSHFPSFNLDIDLSVKYKFYKDTTSTSQDITDQTNQLTNGYDSSSITSSNTALSGSIVEFTGAESQITDQSFGFIDQVQFYDLNMQPQLLACITFCSSWLQSLFVNIGDWGILVMVSLSLGFGLMLIGWFKYRRK